jgi:hypothetical protein
MSTPRDYLLPYDESKIYLSINQAAAGIQYLVNTPSPSNFT